MIKNVILTLFLAICFINFSHAQKVKIKEQAVFIDDKKRLDIDMDGSGTLLAENFFFKDLSGQELFFLKTINDPRSPNEDYVKIVFPQNGKSLTAFKGLETPLILISAMLQDGILDANGKFHADRINIFILKYDEGVDFSQNVIIINDGQ